MLTQIYQRIDQDDRRHILDIPGSLAAEPTAKAVAHPDDFIMPLRFSHYKTDHLAHISFFRPARTVARERDRHSIDAVRAAPLELRCPYLSGQSDTMHENH